MNDNSVKKAIIIGGSDLVSAGAKQILHDLGFAVSALDCRDRSVVAEAVEAGPDFIMIVSRPDTCTLQLGGQLRRRLPDARLVFLADGCDPDDVSRAWHLGMDGYLVKGFSCALLAGAIQIVADGERYFPAAAFEAMPGFNQAMNAARFQDDCAAAALSGREVEILLRLSQGAPNKVLAQDLKISGETVKVHVKAILRKLHVTNRTQAAAWAVRRGAEIGADLHVRAPRTAGYSVIH